ncbi:MAG: FAD-binding oxidoreductase [Acidimicrobiia bacterium]
MKTERPSSYEEAAEVMGRCGTEGQALRIRGGGTKSGWGRPVPDPHVEVSTGGLDRVLEHNAGDLTAVVQAGARLDTVQETFAEEGQMLALDPPTLGAATVGGLLATADSGPLRHRYGGVRDLVLGVTLALSDGTLARAGGKVIKNVAGYDLGKLFAGSFGTLGLVVEMALRLHPLPTRTGTVVGSGDDPSVLSRGASAVAHAPLEADCVDVSWGGGIGSVLVRLGGADPSARLADAAALLAGAGLAVDTNENDDALWAAQRIGQRTQGGDAVMKVSALPSVLPDVLAAAEALGGSVVGRAALGLSWIRLPTEDPGEVVASVEDLRRRLAPAPVVVTDAPGEVRTKLDPWGGETGPVALMRRVKERFDPAGVCAPGLFVGGI